MAVAWRVAVIVALAASAVPSAYFTDATVTARGSMSLSAMLVASIPPPFVAGALVVGAMRRTPGARLAGFWGGALGGALVTVVTFGGALALHPQGVEPYAIPVATLIFVCSGALLAGLGGLAGSALAGGAPAPQPAAPARTARPVDGRCGTCGAPLTPHALQCARCGAWTRDEAPG